MIDRALDFLTAQTWQSLPEVFWLPLFVELPRFVLSAAVIGWWAATRTRTRRAVVLETGITAIVPAHNDAFSVERTVVSLRQQTFKSLQIVVVNDGSTDGTDIACRRLFGAGLVDDYLHLQARGGKAAAVNAALASARHPLFLVTDSDTSFDRDALAEAAAEFADPRVGVVGGTLRVRNSGASLATRIQELNYGFAITIGRTVKAMLGFFFVASGAFGLYRTEAVRGVGGWDVGPGEDGDIMSRLRLAGWTARFAPFAVAMTAVPETFPRLMRQRLRWDRSFVRNRFRKARPHALAIGRPDFDVRLALSYLESYIYNILVPFLFVLYVVFIAGVYGSFAPIILLTVTLVYIAADLLQFGALLAMTTRPREDISLIAYLPAYSVANGYLLRLVRLYATANELVRRGSYTDAYVPAKVRARTQRF